MEAWLKFRAENMTLPIGLSVGRLIFDALNKMEWLFVVIITWQMVIKNHRIIYFIIPVILLAIQTFILLPALNDRVEVVLQGRDLPSSFLHFYYLGIEVVKVVCLFTFGMCIFQQEKNSWEKSI